MELKQSETLLNLMRAFAGESQARNRYTFAASAAKTQKLHVIECIFTFTANQEKEHAEIFLNHMKELNGTTQIVEGTYPVETTKNMLELLRFAAHNEYEEHNPVYPSFAATARQEGFAKIADSFERIAAIEKTHGDRFGKFADLLEQGKLFVADMETKWRCLNCGYIHNSDRVPPVCPVCQHDQGYFVRLSLAPWEN